MAKEDLRVIKTLESIDNALLESLKKLPFNKITVGTLCTKARINRTTFYKHYRDKFDLLDAMIDEALDEEPPFSEREHTLCQRVPANDDYRLLYEGADTLPHVTRHILERGGKEGIPQVVERTGLDEETARLLFVFAASGNIAVNNQMGWERSERFNKVQALVREVFFSGLDHISAMQS